MRRRRKSIYVKKKGSITSYVYSLIRKRKPKWIRAENDVILSGYRYPDKRRVVVELETLTEGTLVIEPKKKKNKQTNETVFWKKSLCIFYYLACRELSYAVIISVKFVTGDFLFSFLLPSLSLPAITHSLASILLIMPSLSPSSLNALLNLFAVAGSETSIQWSPRRTAIRTLFARER